MLARSTENMNGNIIKADNKSATLSILALRDSPTPADGTLATEIQEMFASTIDKPSINVCSLFVEEDDGKTTDRIVFSEVKQSKYDVLYGYPLQRPTGERK